MGNQGDLERHLRDDINTDAPDVVVSELPEDSDHGVSMADVVVDQIRIVTPELPVDGPLDDEAHRGE